MADNINALATFVDSEQFLNALTSGTAPNGIYIVNNVDINNLKTRVQNELNLATIATSGAFGDLAEPPTKAELLEILQLSDQGTAYTNHVDWDNIDNKPNDIGQSSGNTSNNLSDYNNDIGYITSYTETDPIFTASAAAGISTTDITRWDNKSNFSGDYDDLTNKPTNTNVIYDLSNCFNTDLSHLEESIILNINSTLFDDNSNDSILSVFTDLINDFEDHKTVKIQTSQHSAYVTDIYHYVESDTVNFYTLYLTPFLTTNFLTLFEDGTEDMLGDLDLTLEHIIIIIDLINNTIYIKYKEG